MRTYLFDTINRYKRFSENLDVSATLCNKSWWVFNDEGVKSLYIFQSNGDLYVTTNGVGLKGSWQYITANKTVIINSENKVMMFHPVFIDGNILTLTLDGTQQCAFLIDENNRAHFAPRSLSDLSRYFQKKEQKEIEAKRKEQARKRAEEEEARKRAAEEARKRAAEEEARKKAAEGQGRNNGESSETKYSESTDSFGNIIRIIVGIGLIILGSYVTKGVFLAIANEEEVFLAVVLGLVLGVYPILGGLYLIYISITGRVP